MIPLAPRTARAIDLAKARARRTYLYVLVNAVFHSGVYSWLGLYFARRYGVGEVGIGLALLGYGVPGFLFGPLVGRLADRVGRGRLIPVGLAVGSASAIGLAPQVPWAWPPSSSRPSRSATTHPAPPRRDRDGLERAAGTGHGGQRLHPLYWLRPRKPCLLRAVALRSCCGFDHLWRSGGAGDPPSCSALPDGATTDISPQPGFRESRSEQRVILSNAERASVSGPGSASSQRREERSV